MVQSYRKTEECALNTQTRRKRLPETKKQTIINTRHIINNIERISAVVQIKSLNVNTTHIQKKNLKNVALAA